MSDTLAKKPMAYALQTLRLPGETLQDISAQYRELSNEDKNSLIADARVQMAALGVPIKES